MFTTLLLVPIILKILLILDGKAKLSYSEPKLEFTYNFDDEL